MRPRSGAGLYELRPMREEDLDRVHAIESSSYTTPWSRNAFLGEIRGGEASHAQVAVTSQPPRRVVGYICCWIVRDLMQVNNIAVDPAHRGRGLGERMLRRALETGAWRGAQTCFLDVRPSNEAALSLYRKLGFSEVGRRRGYYSDTREDAIVMRLELEGPPAENGASAD